MIQTSKSKAIQLCNIAAEQLGWKQLGCWDGIKRQHGGADSLTKMDLDQLNNILKHARSCGWKIRHSRGQGRHSRALNQEAQARKLRALWLSMWEHGMIRDPGETALCSWASNSRSPNVTALLPAFTVEMLGAAIERLKQWRKRVIEQGIFRCPECSTEMPGMRVYRTGLTCPQCAGVRMILRPTDAE